uniref:Ig-like domain-containing protein n=1 Tax=Ursus americanus TaxID=9643 RepID=A0A452QLH2_URSAM
MAWTPVLLMLLSYCTGSLSQLVLSQPPSLSASLGSSTRLTCTFSTGFSQSGSPPQYLLRIYSDSDTHQGSGVPSWFSGSKDASANAGLLLISGLQAEDKADYFCATAHGGGSSYRYPQHLR